MRLLHEDEFNCVLHLLGIGEKTTLKYSDIQYSGFFNTNRAFDFLLEIQNNDLIEINNSKISYSSFFMDSFLRKYANLVENKDEEGAKKLAESFDLGLLNKTLTTQKSLEETLKIIYEIIENKEELADSDFSRDLFEAIRLEINIKDNLKDYYRKYLEAFKNDELKKSEQPKEDWAKIEYFDRKFYRYKKQREILLDIVRKELETNNPREIRIGLTKELKNNINIYELLACLEDEGIIKNSRNEYSTKSGEEIVLSVSENKIENEKLKIFKNESRINIQPELLVENGIGYLKYFKQGKKIKIGRVETRKYRFLEILIEPLGVAKNIDVIFDNIKVSKDISDSRLLDSYLSQERKKEIIEYVLKELQKIDGLKGNVRLGFSKNKRSAWLILNI